MTWPHEAELQSLAEHHPAGCWVPSHKPCSLLSVLHIAQVAYTRHDAWRHQPDPRALDFRPLSLPAIMGPRLARASPDAKQLFSKLQVAYAPCKGGPQALPACWLLSKLKQHWSAPSNQGEQAAIPLDIIFRIMKERRNLTIVILNLRQILSRTTWSILLRKPDPFADTERC